MSEKNTEVTEDTSDERSERDEESSAEKLPGAPAKDGTALGDTDQHSDA